MGTPGYDMIAYWDWMLGHDLALLVDDRQRLWRFRHTGADSQAGPDARLEAGELVITRRLSDDSQEIAARLDDHHLDLCCRQDGREVFHERVALPPGVSLDEAHATTARHNGVVEVHLPLAQTKPTTPERAAECVAA